MAEAIDTGAIWRSQPVDTHAPTLGALREQADILRWQARRHVTGGYVWGGFCVIQCATGLAHARNSMEIAGNLLCLYGALWLAVWWRRFAIKPEFRHDLPVRDFMAGYRSELLRQQRLSRSLVVVSLAPIAGGLVIAGSGHLAARHALTARSFMTMDALGLFVLAIAWIFGRLQSQQLQFRIAEVDAALDHPPPGCRE